MLDRMFTFAEASELFGIPKTQLAEWVRHGAITPTSGGGKRGKERKFGFTGLLCVGIYHVLRKSGLGTDAMRPISKFLSGMSLADLQASLYQGKTILIGAAGCTPCLANPATYISNRGGAVLAIAIDIEAAYRIAVAGIEQRSPKPMEVSRA